MKKNAVYLIAQTVVCCALAALVSMSVISIWREGSLLRAFDPTADIYTPRIVSERLAPIAPLFFVSLGLLIAGLALGIRDDRAQRPEKDVEHARDLAVMRVNHPSEAMRRERAARRRLSGIGWGAFALCMAPIAAYLVNPDHYSLDFESMFLGLMRVLLPWTCAGLGALALTAALQKRRAPREVEAARARMREESALGMPPAIPRDARSGKPAAVRATILIAAAALIIAGILNGSARDVLYKAISICTECIGLG